MTTITIKVNNRNKAGRTFLEMLEIFRTQKNAITIVEPKKEEKSPYNPKFVKKIKAAAARGNYREIDPKNIWASIK